MKIEVIKVINKEEREVYSFTLFLTSSDQIQCVFTEYQYQVKPSAKKMWRREKYWNTYELRHSNTEEPKLSLGIMSEANKLTQERVKVLTWNEFQKR